jgi:hypothetical protein
MDQATDFAERETLPPEAPGRWAVVELMGHRTRAGFVTEDTLFGIKFVRIAIPWRDPAKGERTIEHYRPDSVYGIRWCDEATARAVAGQYEPYEAPAVGQLTSGSDDDELEQEADDREGRPY